MVIQVLLPPQQNAGGSIGLSEVTMCPGLSSVNACTFCREFEAKAETQLMIDLPSCRLQPYTPPFHHTACDYFGPIKVKLVRNKTAKHHGVIFTCLNTCAVHCELATDASTMDFLQVLPRFFSYRGYPK